MQRLHRTAQKPGVVEYGRALFSAGDDAQVDQAGGLDDTRLF
jgi:hypothetical protein